MFRSLSWSNLWLSGRYFKRNRMVLLTLFLLVIQVFFFKMGPMVEYKKCSGNSLVKPARASVQVCTNHLLSRVNIYGRGDPKSFLEPQLTNLFGIYTMDHTAPLLLTQQSCP